MHRGQIVGLEKSQTFVNGNVVASNNVKTVTLSPLCLLSENQHQPIPAANRKPHKVAVIVGDPDKFRALRKQKEEATNLPL